VGVTAGRAAGQMLRIGCVKYLNALPLIHGWQQSVEFDHPSRLCKCLANGELDVALVSSFEFLRNPIYRIVDDVSISSNGPVYSVLVAHRGPLSAVQEIELDPASETAVNLLRCLLAELKLRPRVVENKSAILASPASARLLIGDRAIRFRERHAGEFQFWDLGEQWKKHVGLPFVYALWLIRPEIADAKAIATRLRGLRDQNLGSLQKVISKAVAAAAAAGEPKSVNREFFSRYYREHLQFRFGERQKKGLQVFASLCAQHGLLQKANIELSLV
jgi:chorismate dehydratase